MTECQRTILITGASGTLGRNIVAILSRDSRNRLILPLRKEPKYFPDFDRPAIRAVTAHIQNMGQLRQLLDASKPAVVIHCAAAGLKPSRPTWFEMAAFNVDLSLRLFEATCGPDDCHFILVSSGLAYKEQGRPLRESDPLDTLHPYGASKAGADLLLRAAAAEFGRRLTVVRPFSFTGPYDAPGRLFPTLLQCARDRRPMGLTAGWQIRDFCGVEDIAAGIVQAMDAPPQTDGAVFNLGSGRSTTVRELVTEVCESLGLEVELRFGECEACPFEPRHLVADIQKARRVLGWVPRVSIAYSVWRLARQAFPDLAVREPESSL